MRKVFFFKTFIILIIAKFFLFNCYANNFDNKDFNAVKEYLNNSLFANTENLKIFNVLEDFHKLQKNVSIDTIKNYIPDIQSKTHKDLSFQIDQIVFSFVYCLLDMWDYLVKVGMWG